MLIYIHWRVLILLWFRFLQWKVCFMVRRVSMANLPFLHCISLVVFNLLPRNLQFFQLSHPLYSIDLSQCCLHLSLGLYSLVLVVGISSDGLQLVCQLNISNIICTFLDDVNMFVWWCSSYAALGVWALLVHYVYGTYSSFSSVLQGRKWVLQY